MEQILQLLSPQELQTANRMEPGEGSEAADLSQDRECLSDGFLQQVLLGENLLGNSLRGSRPSQLETASYELPMVHKELLVFPSCFPPLFTEL